jgi:signal transduction histidine kinase
VTARAAVLPSIRPQGTWLLPVAAGFVAATALVIPTTTAWATTYSGASTIDALVDLLAGGGLIAAGAAVLLIDRRPRLGELAMLAGLAWLSPDWIGWQGGPAFARTLAMLVSPLFPALLLGILDQLSRGSTGTRLPFRVLVIAYATTGLVAVLGVLFRDPLVDDRCWSNCTDDVLLLANAPLIANLVAVVAPLVSGTISLTIAGVAAVRLTHATAAERRTAAPVVAAIGFVALGVLGLAVANLVLPHEGPQFLLFAALFQVRAWATAMVALGLCWVVVQGWRRSATVAGLARELAEPASVGAFAMALAAAMGDPSLSVFYPLPDGSSFTDPSGRPVPPPVADGRHAVTRIVRAGRLVAMVRHDALIVDPERLEQAVGAAGRLALENERLRAELLARLEELRASRARIVAAADAERRRLERDLHDGAQQRFLALLHELRRARDNAAASGDGAIVARLGEAIGEAETLIGDLREVAHGIYPATLGERGLRGALRTLADVAPLPVELETVPDGRFPDAVERAVYAIVAGVVDAAARDGSGYVGLRLTADGDGGPNRALRLELDGVSVDAIPSIEDQVAAADGSVEVEGSTVRARIPCASS